MTRGEDQLKGFNKTGFSDRQHCTNCGGQVLIQHPTHRAWSTSMPKPCAASTSSRALHVNYQEKVLPVRDGLPKFKDFPEAFGGSTRRFPSNYFFQSESEHGFADQQEQEERRPGGDQRRIGAGIAHRQAEIVGDEIGEAQRHPDGRAKQHLARAGEAEGGDRGEQRHQQGRQRAGDLVGEPGAGLVGGAAGRLELGDALLQRPIIELGRDRPWPASAGPA